MASTSPSISAEELVLIQKIHAGELWLKFFQPRDITTAQRTWDVCEAAMDKNPNSIVDISFSLLKIK